MHPCANALFCHCFKSVMCKNRAVLPIGYEIGTMMLIFTMALAYSVSSPIILPLALVYFIVQL